MTSRTGATAGRSGSGIGSDTCWGKLDVSLLGSRPPVAFTTPRTLVTNRVRVSIRLTKASELPASALWNVHFISWTLEENGCVAGSGRRTRSIQASMSPPGQTVDVSWYEARIL